MKKSLLFAVLGSLSIGSFAQPATSMVEDFYGQKMSPNGKYLLSNYYGMLQIYNNETGRIVFDYSGDQLGGWGLGSAVSDAGVAVGSNDMEQAIIIIDNKMVIPDWKDETITSSNFHSISADATRVCGYTTGGSTLYALPIVADITPTGEITKWQVLPHPDKDFLGREPQHITAVEMSADGKIILGQIVDWTGFVQYPIIYTEGADGKWSYTLPSEKDLNPNNIELPYCPAEGPTGPNYEDFMTAEQIEKYNAAYQEYIDSGYNEDLLPKLGNFMTPEQAEAYNVAVAEYNKLADEYNKQLSAYYEAFDNILDSSLNFTFNQMAMTADGKKFVCSAEIGGEDFYSPTTYIAYEFNIADGTYGPINSTLNLITTDINDNGTIFAATPVAMGAMPPQAYVKPADASDFVSIEKYLETNNPEMSKWVVDNLTGYNIEIGFDPDTYEPIMGDYLFSGQPISNADGTVIAGNTKSYAFHPTATILTYVLNGVKTSGGGSAAIDGINSDSDLVITSSKGGLIIVDGECSALTVYDLSGRTVFSSTSVGNCVDTGLTTGIYIVKAIGANGSTATAKVSF